MFIIPCVIYYYNAYILLPLIISITPSLDCPGLRRGGRPRAERDGVYAYVYTNICIYVYREIVLHIYIYIYILYDLYNIQRDTYTHIYIYI